MKKEKSKLELSRREQQDLMDKIILQNLMKIGLIRWTKLEKKVLGTRLPFATSQRFRSRMKYLLSKKFIEKVHRGTYKITESGIKYLDTLNTVYRNFDEILFNS